MIAPALKALAAAKAAGIKITLDRDGLILEGEPPPPSDIVALLKTVKPDLLRIMAGREAALAAFNGATPVDCLPRRWAEAQDGLQRFVSDGGVTRRRSWGGRLKSSTECRRSGAGSI
jgi:hypothetical protein